MSDAIEYVDLKGDALTARFQRDGSVSVRLKGRHARACAALLNTWESAYSIKDAGFARRMWVILHGWWVTARVGLFHSRLTELMLFLVLQQPQCRMQREGDGQVFRFERRTR